MQITSVKVHNFRSLVDVEFSLQNYSLLVGANNSGKTNVIDALRVFYEDSKFTAKTDIPAGDTDDAESWIEIEYKLTNSEHGSLKGEYQLENSRLRVRKRLTGASKGIFAYTTEGLLSEEQFYGTKNVQQGKLGDIIYIPAVSTLTEHMKTSGPSALRNIINGIVAKLVKSSPTFQEMINDFSKNMEAFQDETTDDNFSLSGLQNDINDQISGWDTEFRLNINPFSETEIVKNLVSFDFLDHQLSNTLPPSNYGQGFQRHVIYTLLTLVSKYSPTNAASRKKDFKPDLTLILFEEPEAFLHPPQQELLCQSLQSLGAQEGNQILISTHSSNFVSQNTDDLCSLIHLRRRVGKTEVGQLSADSLQRIFHDNQQINSLMNVPAGDENWDLNMEAVKYFLWLDPYRCGLFFAERVLLVEGPTEVVFINYLLSIGRIPASKGGLFVLDCMGKYNIHRFMNLLGELGIKHSVLYDEDDLAQHKHKNIASLISTSKTTNTCHIESVAPDIEKYLGVPKASRPHQKPQHLLYQYHQCAIDSAKLNSFVALIGRLLQ